MASITYTGQLGAGVPTFSTNVTDLDIAWTGGGPRLYVTTRPGPGAGYSVYDLSAPAGPAALIGVQGYPTWITNDTTPQVAVVGGTLIAAGLTPSGWASYALTAQGGFGAALNTPLAFDPTAVAASTGDEASFVYFALAGSGQPLVFTLGQDGTLTAIAPPASGPPPGEQIDSLTVADTASGSFLFAASAAGNRVSAYAIAADGSLSAAGSYDAAQGVGLSKPTAVATLTMNGTTYAVVAGSESSSLTVFRVLPGGGLFPVDHLVDSLTTRFAGATAMTTLQVGSRAYVMVGGADDGFEVMTMLPDGRLIQVLSATDTAGLSLADVSALAAAQIGGRVMLFAASASEPGISQFDLALGSQGVTLVGGAGTVSGTGADDLLVAGAATTALIGGAGDDILVAAGISGAAVLWGGAGGDRFVLSPSQQVIRVADYQTGIDRLDLTSFPLLRNLGQLLMAQTAIGAEITYLGTTIRIDSADGNPIPLTAFAQSQMLGLTRFPPYATTALAVGTTGADTLMAAAEDTSLAGLDGADSLTGATGNDHLDGGTGADTLAGGAGNDLLDGGAGGDWFDAGDGRDTLVGGVGDDWADAGDGDDFLSGDAGRDTLAGGMGHDLIDGGADDDTLGGDEGDDTLAGGLGNDHLTGGGGDDTLAGGDGDDLLLGLGGNDSLTGDANNDTIYAGAGLDTLRGGDGAEILYGELDDDFLFSGSGDDTALGGKGDDFLYGEPGNDMLQGQLGNDRLWGGLGFDTLLGGDGDDFLDGGPEGDALYGDAGNDTADGGDGGDYVAGGLGNDWLIGNTGNDSLTGDQGDDTLFGSSGDDHVSGGDGGDRLYGEPGNDQLFGYGGTDMMWGGKGNDTLFGGPDSDFLFGELGDDVLHAGLGLDYIYGGPGQDQFVFVNIAQIGTGAASDLILDFERGADRVNLTGLGLTFRGAGGFSGQAGDLRFNVAGAGGYLSGDMNGDRLPDFSLWLDNVYALQASDLFL